MTNYQQQEAKRLGLQREIDAMGRPLAEIVTRNMRARNLRVENTRRARAAS